MREEMYFKGYKTRRYLLTARDIALEIHNHGKTLEWAREGGTVDEMRENKCEGRGMVFEGQATPDCTY